MSDAIELTAREIAEAGTHTHVAGTTVGKPIDECAVCGWDIRCHNGVGITLADRIAAALRSLPAVPPAAERLPRRATAEMLVAAVDAACVSGSTVEDVVNAALRAAPPAAEPAIFQKPGSSLDEAAVRGNNPEPAAEPAPCGTCGGSGNDPYTMTGEDGTKPCATCGGVGIVLDGPITHVTKRCPSCSPGGAA